MKKIKISELPLYQSLKGLFTIGTDAQNRSVKVSLEFIETATNEAVEKANNATSDAVDAKKNADEATTKATEAATAANNAATSANDAADKATDAASTATNSASTADRSATNANNAADAAKEAQTNAEEATKDTVAATEAAKEATTAANDAAEHATTTADDTKADVLDTLGRLVPTALTASAPEHLTLGNTSQIFINAVLSPTTAMKNVIYQVDGDAVRVTPDGKLAVCKEGTAIVYVIPTCNVPLYKALTIRVTAPTARLVSNRSTFRLTSSGALRLN